MSLVLQSLLGTWGVGVGVSQMPYGERAEFNDPVWPDVYYAESAIGPTLGVGYRRQVVEGWQAQAQLATQLSRPVPSVTLSTGWIRRGEGWELGPTLSVHARMWDHTWENAVRCNLEHCIPSYTSLDLSPGAHMALTHGSWTVQLQGSVNVLTLNHGSHYAGTHRQIGLSLWRYR